MRKVIVNMHVSLDGFVEGPRGEMDWITSDAEEVWADLFEHVRSADTFLLGGGMYPAYEIYWRGLLAKPTGSKFDLEYARLADKTPHVVFSTTLKKADWQNTTLVRDNLADEVKQMKRQPGKDMILLGGPGIVSAFMNLGLVDELRLFVESVLLARGKPLFDHIQPRQALKLMDVRVFGCGIVAQHYQVNKQ